MARKSRTVPAELLDEVLKQDKGVRANGVVVGTVDAIDDSGAPVVSFQGGSGAARSLAPLTGLAAGCHVALLFEGGDLRRPIILGAIQGPDVAKVDDEEVVLEAGKKVVLRCSESSITMTREGKIVIRGKTLLARAEGTHRIKGGSVQIN